MTPPNVGSVSRQIDRRPASSRRASAADVLAICISEIAPSCMRAPPEAVMISSGSRWSRACSAARVTISPTALPIDPPMNAKSIAATTTGWPLIRPTP